MSKRIVIRQAGKIVDVFFGEEGWEEKDWARFLIMPNKYLKFLRGASLTPEDYTAVTNMV
jgi:hypothetical protein